MYRGFTQAVTKGASVTEQHHFSAAGLPSPPTTAGIAGFCQVAEPKKKQHCAGFVLVKGKEKKNSTFWMG